MTVRALAYERLVDRLLSSPHYGERWARHWMDLVHFAETHGHDQDRIRPNAWPYRDYLIRSFNRDTPYPRFVAEQVAADALFPDEPELVVALGMLAAGPWDESSLRDIRDDSIDRQIGHYIDRDDMVSTVMSTFVSATVHCARCHDHKFDPISQDDYYSLQAVFAGVDKAERGYDADTESLTLRRRLTAERKAAEKAQPEPGGLDQGRAGGIAAAEPGLRGGQRLLAGRRSHAARRPARRERSQTRRHSLSGQAGFTRHPGCLPGLAGPLQLEAKRRRIAPPGQAGALDHRPAQSAHLAVDRQPGLAAAFRPRTGLDSQRLRTDGRAAIASGAARLAGDRVPRIGRLTQAARSADRDERRLPAELDRRPELRRHGRRQPMALATESAPARRRVHSRRDPCARRAARPDDGWSVGAAVHLEPGRSRHAGGRLHRPTTGTAPARAAVRFTDLCSARCPTRSTTPSIRPTRRSSPRCGTSRPRRSRRSSS